MSNSDRPVIDQQHFRKVLGQFPTGVTVVATHHDGRTAGLAVGSFFSVSLDPPLVGFCVGKGSDTWKVVEDAGHFVVNVLSEDQGPTSGRFATKGEDKFEGIDWVPGPSHGSPRIDGCLAHIDCSLHTIYDGGDHAIVIGLVHSLDVHNEVAGPLVYFQSAYRKLADL